MRTGTLSKQIAEDVLKKQKPRDINRASFLALREEIIAAMDDGWPIKRIWETLHGQGKISFSYPAFTGYVNRLILQAVPQSKPSPMTDITMEVVKPEQTQTQTGVTPKKNERPADSSSTIKEFKYNPNIDLEELF